MSLKKFAYLLPGILWIIALFSFSSQPYQQQTIIPFLTTHFPQETLASWLPNVYFRYGHDWLEAKTNPYHFTEFVFRKCAHVFSYSVLACTLYFSFNAVPERFRHPAVKWIALPVGLGIVASLDEWNQKHVSMRTGQSVDVWLDVIGGTIGATLFLLIVWMIARSRRRGKG